MPTETRTEIVGAKETLRELAKFDKEAANALRREARKIMQPIVDDAKANIPNVALSGMSRPWVSAKSGAKLTPWDGTVARKYVKAKTSTKKPREFGGITRDLAVFYVSWAGGVNMIFDAAGRRNRSLLASNLTSKFGPASRVMWPAAEKNEARVESEMSSVIDTLVDLTNRRISGVSA